MKFDPAIKLQELVNSSLEELRSSRPEVALSIIEEAFRSGSVIRDMNLLRGMCLLSLQSEAAGIAAFEAELAAYPDNVVAADLLKGLKRTDTSKLLSELTECEGALARAGDFISAGDPQSALGVLEELKGKDTPRGLHYLMGIAFISLGKLSYAHEALWEEIRYYPDNMLPREILKQLDPTAVLQDFFAHLEERSGGPYQHRMLWLEGVKGGIVPGGIYLRQKMVTTVEERVDERTVNLLKAYSAVQIGNLQVARQRAEAELLSYPDNVCARDLLDRVVRVNPDIRGVSARYSSAGRASKPYVVIFPGIDAWYEGRTLDLGRFLLGPVFNLLLGDSDLDVTMLVMDGRHGLQGTDYSIGPLRVSRRPDALFVMRPWWGEEGIAAFAARDLGIPVIMLGHGTTYYASPAALEKKSISPATVGCVWSRTEYDILTQTHGSVDTLIITGNPMFDVVADPVPFPISRFTDLPKNFALVLTSTQGYGKEIFARSASQLSRFMPVVVKTHPAESDVGSWKSLYPTFTDVGDLMELLYRCSIVVGDLSSSLIPAIYWEKRIFIMTDPCVHIETEVLRARWGHLFNFTTDPEWSEAMIESAVPARREDYESVGHYADGKNAERVANVIKYTLS